MEFVTVWSRRLEVLSLTVSFSGTSFPFGICALFFKNKHKILQIIYFDCLLKCIPKKIVNKDFVFVHNGTALVINPANIRNEKTSCPNLLLLRPAPRLQYIIATSRVSLAGPHWLARV